MHLPGLLYRQLPWIYVVTGGVTLVYLPSVVGIVSGVLLIFAGSLVLLWRSSKSAKRGTNKAQERKPTADSHSARNGLARHRHSTGAFADWRDEIIERELLLARQMLGERRLVPDRRGWQPMPYAAFTDSEGMMVVRDRRHSADRRTGSIQVKELGTS